MASSTSSAAAAAAAGSKEQQDLLVVAAGILVASAIGVLSVAYALLHRKQMKGSEPKGPFNPSMNSKGILASMKALRQRVIRLDNGTTYAAAYDSSISESHEDQITEYTKGEQVMDVRETGRMKVRLSKVGISSAKPLTVFQLFKKAKQNFPNSIALKAADPDSRSWTWTQYYDDTICVAKALLSFGFKQGDSVNIIGFNAPEYFLMEMGAIACGGKAAGIYTTNSPEACHYVSEHSKARVIAVQNLMQLKKFLSIKNTLPCLCAIVVWNDVNEAELPSERGKSGGKGADCEILTWAQFISRGKNVGDDSVIEDRISKTDPGDPVTLIYTSGTTGNPKAVMVSNDNCTWTSRSMWSTVYGGQSVPLSESIRIVSYLPLSHIAAQMTDVFGPLFAAAELAVNATVYFADDQALKGTILKTLLVARPTMFFGVPRVWEKFKEAIAAKGATNTGLKRKLIDWAKRQGLGHLEASQNKGKHNGLLSPILFPIAKILLNKVRQNMGLDACVCCFTGAAPINVDILTFFGVLNIPVLELYGMSESTGPHTISYNLPYEKKSFGFQIGSCGPCMPGVEMMTLHVKGRDPPGNGEICYRGRHIMMGYMGDLNKSKDAIDEDGWLHSGDVGRIDDDGMLYITGRIKELIITEGGENIAPVPVEEHIKSSLPAISNFVMIGDRRHFCSGLVTLKVEVNPDGTPSNRLDRISSAISPNSKTLEEASKDPIWLKYIQGGIDKYNSSMAVSQAQKIQKFVILDREFSVAGGELGPTLKLKRSEVSKIYQDVIEKIYKSA